MLLKVWSTHALYAQKVAKMGRSSKRLRDNSKYGSSAYRNRSYLHRTSNFKLYALIYFTYLQFSHLII